MGKRIAPEQQTAAVNTTRKRKRVCNDDQQDTKSDQQKWVEETTPPKSPEPKAKHLAILNPFFDENSPKPVYHLRPSVVNGILLEDITEKQWRIGKPIGKGNFGEIFLASDNLSVPVTSDNAEYVVKIEPHSNGPLFVEIHCLLNTAKKNGNNPLPPGMPEYIASGSHYFGDARYRFLVIKRFDRDLHSLIKNRRITQKSVLTLALQILDVLQHLHDKGYCHNDIKAQNLMISNCTYRKSQLRTDNKGDHHDGDEEKVKTCSGSEYSDADSGNSSNEEDCDDEVKSEKKGNDADEDEEEEEIGDEDEDMYKTPANKKNRSKTTIQYSGSNPVRSCRRDKRNSIYDEMVKSHYLRPAKRISYSEFFNEDNSKDASDTQNTTSCRISRTSVRKTTAAASSALKKNRFASESSADEEQDEDDEEGSDKSGEDDEEVITEERVFLIDFGLASKFMDKGVHRPFVMDQRRAHDGTLEFTSRDAHMGAHSRRSDLECLGYNLVYWSQGYLPWRDAAAQHQNEKVHWVKEYLMKDVKEMLKHIYGKQVPKYLGEYLQYVGQLAYHERPDYEKCRRIFIREYISLGYNANDIHLNTEELIKTSVKVKEEIENNNVIEMKNIKSIMKNLNVIMPFHESTLSNRVSPKNLRSKSAKKKSSRKKFSWTEILSQDPDQIARDRAEKEFDREPAIETPMVRYEGKPTYAILEIQNRLKLKDRMDAYVADEGSSDDDAPAPQTQSNKACSVKKRNALHNEVRVSVNCNDSNNKAVGAGAGAGAPSVRSTRTKAGIKTFITTTTTTTPSIANTTSTKRGTATGTDSNATHLTTNNNTSITKKKEQRRTRRCLIKTGSTGEFTTTDESSCSSINSNSIPINHTNNQIHHRTAVVKIKRGEKPTTMARVGRKKVNRSDRCSSTDRSSNNSSSYVNSEDDTSSFSDHAMLFSPKVTRKTAKKLSNKMLHPKTVSASPCLVNNEDVVGAKRRKRSIPKKRKSSTKGDCFEGEMIDERDLRTFKKRACRG